MNQIIKSIMAIFMVFLLMMAFTGSAIATKENPTEKKSVIIMFKDKPDRDLIKHYGGDIKTVYHIKPAIAASIPQKAIDGLKRNPKIDYIVNDLEIFTVGETLPWGVDSIDADIVHGYNKGAGVNVAILDSGIDYLHSDLADNYEYGFDFSGAFDGAPNDNDPMDYSGHGTHVAGTVAAIDNEIGVIGVAPEADLYILKVFADDGYGSYSDVIEALEWCINTTKDDDSENDIQVISMSFGSSYKSIDPGIEPWINDAYDAGILLVGAAGNDGNRRGIGDNVIYPARYDNVIAVAATDSNNNRAVFSSTGSDVELAAPGVSILSTLPDGNYGYYSGTSMACPHVTGTAALVIASDSSLSNDQVRQILRDTADYLGDPSKYGYGLVDADGAAPPTEIPNQLPVADAGTGKTALVGEEVTLDGSGSYDPDGTITAYDWTFGDGTTGTGEITTHSYSTAGTYTATLTVTDDDGATDADTAIITINEAPNNPPVADAGTDKTALVGEEVTLDGSGSYDPDGTITAYDWTFGDGTTGTGEITTHSYSTAGTYTATLTVTDDDGATDTDTATVTVSEVGSLPTMHISSIDVSFTSTKKAGPNIFGYATAVVTIEDGDGTVEGAMVSGYWSGATSYSDSGETNTTGIVSLDSDIAKVRSGDEFTFTVTNVECDGLIWDVKSESGSTTV